MARVRHALESLGWRGAVGYALERGYYMAGDAGCANHGAGRRPPHTPHLAPTPYVPLTPRRREADAIIEQYLREGADTQF